MAAVLLLAGGAGAQQPSVSWPEVTRESRPWTRWWWMGSAVDSTTLSSELEALAAAGFGGVEVTSIYGVRGREAQFVPYLSDRWLRLVAHAASEARRLGMGLDLPPGSGWRMGGPAVPLEEASTSLRISVDTVRGGGTWTPRSPGRRPDAAVAVSSAGRVVDIAGAAPAAGALQWTAPAGVWTVYAAESHRNGEKVKRPAPGGEGNAVDVLSRGAVRSYLDQFGARSRALPHGAIRSWFHDSYEYTGDGSVELFGAFQQRRGYDLRRFLPALAGSGDPDTVARVKSDYRQTVDEMLLHNLLRPFTAWAHSRGGLSRNQAHGSPGNLLDLYAASDIPETEIFGPLGGRDADPLVSKFASSAAHVSGKRLTSAEGMTWLGEHFTVTLDQVKQAADQLFVSGVNHLVYHGTAYSPQDAAWPGWLFYAATQFNPRNAIWRDLPALNHYVARVQSVLQRGHPSQEVLLHWPVHDSWHDPAGRRMDFRVHDPKWLHEKPVGKTAAALWDQGYGFDYVSDRQLREHVRVSGGRLAAGAARYRVLLVPRTQHMPPETMERLLELARQGATVAFHQQLPPDVPGLADLDARRRRLGAARRSVSFAAAGADGVRTAAVGKGRVLLASEVGALLATAGARREAMVDHPGVRFIRRVAPGEHLYFVANSGPAALDGWVPLAVSAKVVGIMDPMTGAAGLAQVRSGPRGRPEVRLQLEPGASLILRALERPVRAPRWTYREPIAQPAAVPGRWRVEFVAGGPELPRGFDTDSLGSWAAGGGAAERFAGTARYSIRFEAPGTASNYLLDLGRVAESARVRLNGRELGTLFARPFRLETGPLRPRDNELQIEVTNLSANRIRDLDRRGVPWKIFHDINFVGIDYKPFDAAGWPVRPSGLLGPVRLQPLAR